jgi:cyanobactin cluster PatC/TenC/TruC protein
VSPAPRKPAKKPAARKPPVAEPAAAVAPTTAPSTAVAAPAGARSPALLASTGQLSPGGSASSPLPTLTPFAPGPPVTVTVTGRTPGVALPLGGDLDEPRPTPLEITRVSAAPLETGLSDYAFWAEYFANYQSPPAPEGFRRGEIWA